MNKQMFRLVCAFALFLISVATLLFVTGLAGCDANGVVPDPSIEKKVEEASLDPNTLTSTISMPVMEIRPGFDSSDPGNAFDQTDQRDEMSSRNEDDGSDTSVYQSHEVCDGIDNDGDGRTDIDPIDFGIFQCPDDDGDGVAHDCEFSEGIVACGVLEFYSPIFGDCDDDDPSVSKKCGEEICNGLDDDHNGLVDDSPTDGIVQCPDDDWDGLGSNDSMLTIQSCVLEPGYVPWDGDCDDGNPDVPYIVDGDAVEIPDNDVDEDCDGVKE